MLIVGVMKVVAKAANLPHSGADYFDTAELFVLLLMLEVGGGGHHDLTMLMECDHGMKSLMQDHFPKIPLRQRWEHDHSLTHVLMTWWFVSSELSLVLPMEAEGEESMFPVDKKLKIDI